MPEWWDELIQKPFMQIPFGQVLLYSGASITVMVGLYKRFPAIKTGAMTAYTFVTLVPVVRRQTATLERIRSQVENSHDTNLRDELDTDRADAIRRHEELLNILRGVKTDIRQLNARDVERGREIRELGARLDSTDMIHHERLGELENTLETRRRNVE